MPKYTVEEVVDIIQSLTADEKSLLKTQLPAILEGSLSSAGNVQTRSMSVGGSFTVSGTGVSVDMSQTQADGDVNFSKNTSGTTGQTLPIQEILYQVVNLEKAVLHSSILTASEREAAQKNLKTIITELQKPEPDKGFVQQAIATLKEALEGVLTLATPVIKVAELVATAWLI